MQDVYRRILGEDAPEWRVQMPPLDCGALMRRVCRVLPAAKEADVSTQEGCALARLNTLSKKAPCGCPEDANIKRALWLCLGAAAFPHDPKRTRTRLKAAAQAVQCLTHGVAPKERELLRSRLGEPADAMARLMSFAINQDGG